MWVNRKKWEYFLQKWSLLSEGHYTLNVLCENHIQFHVLKCFLKFFINIDKNIKTGLPDGIECNVPYTPGQTLQCILDGTIYNLTEANSTSKANSPTTQSITTSTLEKSTSSESSKPSLENIMTSKETQTTSALDSQTMPENTQESTKPKTSSDLIYDNNGTRIVLSLILIPSCFFIVYEFVYRK